MDPDRAYTEIDRIFFRDGYNLAGSFLSGGAGRNEFAGLSQTLYASIDSLIESFINRVVLDGDKIDCKKGCSWCCSQAVFVLPYEIIHIDSCLRNRAIKPDMKKMRTRTQIKHRRTITMGMKELLAYRSPCPLLNDGICSCYEARPMACRIYLSRSVLTCERDFYHPEDIHLFPSLYDFPLHAGRMLNEGVCTWLREQGFSISEIPLEYGLSFIFKNYDVLESWINKEDTFGDRSFSEDELKLLNRAKR